MTDISAVQPSFFEGQYLGADDLAAIVEYLRTGLARHALSARTWGVVAGLELVAGEIAPGEYQVVVTPGVALDGYGRLIVVTAPAEIPAEKLIGIDSGAVKVWIRYAERPVQGARAGYGTCGAEDAYARINETFEIEVGERSGIVDRQSGVSLSGVVVADAREAARASNPDAPLHCDGSVPYQDYPIDDQDSLWLVPLGTVVWRSATSAFDLPTDEQRIAGRLFRRVQGSVAESLYAANGLIRLRGRDTPFDADIDAACGATSTEARDFLICDGDLKARELVWLEGDTRLTGDLRMFGTRLEFRDAEGRDYIPRTAGGVSVEAIDPLLMDRAANAKNGEDLRVLLGQASEGHNRFTIGPATVSGGSLCDLQIDGAAQVVVQDNGLVGIGTAGAPDSDLSAPLTLRGLEGSVTVTDPVTGVSSEEAVWSLINFENASGDMQWELGLWTDGEGLALNRTGAAAGTFFLSSGGNLGVGTTDPEARLEVAGMPVGASGGLGNNLWFRLGDGGAHGDAGRLWVEYGPEQAPLMVLSDHDNPPRIQFQQTGNGGDEFAADHVTWIGHLTGASEDFGIVGGGRIGLGTDTPFADVTVDGTIGFKLGTAPLIQMFESGTANDRRMVLSHSPGFPDWGLRYSDVGDRFVYQRDDTAPTCTIDLAGQRVGVGTETPQAALDVRGSVRLGNAGDLFALGAGSDLRVVVGEVNANGTVARGSGFTSARSADGDYTVTFTPGFSGVPFVVVTGYGDIDNLVSIASRNSASCTVRTWDVLDNAEAPGARDTAFMFIAMGAK